MKSSRTDGLGHWPAGKRRNKAPLSAALRAAIERLVVRGISRRSLARNLNISASTLRRWIVGEDWPSAAHLAALRRIVGRVPERRRSRARTSAGEQPAGSGAEAKRRPALPIK